VKRFPDDPQPDIKYPTWWTYTVIGPDRNQLEEAITKVVEDRSHTVSLSNLSKTGKYCSLTLKMIVLNDEERRTIYEALRAEPVVTLVL
jgi:putative lipoic acid-binding regulatory protein